MQPTYLLALERLGEKAWPILDAELSDRVVGYRYDSESGRVADYREPYLVEKERLTKSALDYPWVAKADIRNFFGEVRLEKIAGALAESFPSLATLSEHLLAAFRAGLGHLPPGSSTARILANWWLADIDSELEEALPEGTWSRWLDDYTFLVASKQEARYCVTLLERLLNERGLALSPEKTLVARADSERLPLGDPELDSMGEISEYTPGFVESLGIKLERLNFGDAAWKSTVRFCLGRLRAVESDRALAWVIARQFQLASEWRAVARYLAVLDKAPSAEEGLDLLLRSSEPSARDWRSILTAGALARYTRRARARGWLEARVLSDPHSAIGHHASVAFAWMGAGTIATSNPTTQWALLFERTSRPIPSDDSSPPPMAI